MKYVKFSPSTMSPAKMVLAASANETGFTNNALLFTGAPWTVINIAAQRVIVSGKITAENDAALALAEIIKEKFIETDKLGQMLLGNASFVDTKAIADPVHGDSIANKGGYPARHGAVHTDAVPPASEHFSVAIGIHLGEADLHCDAIKEFGDITYKYWYSLNVTSYVWVLGDAGKNSMTLKALPIDVPIAFKVVGSNLNGPGYDSAIIVKTLPKA